MVAQWYKDQIKGSPLARHRHRVALISGLITVGIGLAYSFSPKGAQIRQDRRDGKYAPSEYMVEKRAAFSFTGGVTPTREQKNEFLRNMLQDGYDDIMEMRSPVETPPPVPPKN